MSAQRFLTTTAVALAALALYPLVARTLGLRR